MKRDQNKRGRNVGAAAAKQMLGIKKEKIQEHRNNRIKKEKAEIDLNEGTEYLAT